MCCKTFTLSPCLVPMSSSEIPSSQGLCSAVFLWRLTSGHCDVRIILFLFTVILGFSIDSEIRSPPPHSYPELTGSIPTSFQPFWHAASETLKLRLTLASSSMRLSLQDVNCSSLLSHVSIYMVSYGVLIPPGHHSFKEATDPPGLHRM